MKNFYLFGLLILALIKNVVSQLPIDDVPGYANNSIKVYQGSLLTRMAKKLPYILI